MAVGAVHGRRILEGLRTTRRSALWESGLYRFFNGIAHDFKAQYGALDCKTLNKDYPEWQDKNRFKACMKMVIAAAGMAAEYIEKGNTEGYTQPLAKT